jgi:hypothetical protein
MFGCTPDSEKFAGFVLPILKELPYVSSVPFVRGTGAHYGARSYGLMFNQRIEAYDQKVTSKAS